MALLSFPSSPTLGQYYPAVPLPGQNQYQWETATSTWRLLGAASGATPGTYGNPITVPQITIDATGRITVATNVAIQLADTTQIGLVQLVNNTTTNDATKALTAAQGYILQNQIGDTSLLNPFAPNLVTAVNAANATTGVGAGTYGNSLNVGQFTVNSQGRITSATNVAIALATAVSPGIVQLATNLQTQLGINSTAAVTPSSLQSKLSDSTTLNSATSIASSKAVYDLAAQFTALTPKYITYDDISTQFDGVKVAFQLKVATVARPPSPSSNIMVFVGGIAQTPGYAYTVAGSTITFTVAPPTNSFFYATTVGF